MDERIKKLRKALDLTQREFGDRIGVKPNTIATYEIGRNQPIDAVISLICREFNVSETWLRTGEGEMFLPKADTALDRLAAEHNLTSADYLFVEKFLGLKPDSRKIIIDYIREVAAALNSDTTPLDIVTTRKNTDIDTEVGYYRSDLLMDKRLSAADAGQQQEIKSPQEMTVAELHAELDRQIAEEKKRAEGLSVSGPGSSEKATG